MALSNLSIGSLAPDQVFSTLQQQGLTSVEAANFVATWILETVGKTRRNFDYKQNFVETDPNCAAKFARSFAHQDWVDGESVVQASETVGEAGFNVRFHRIEADFDAMTADVAMAFACIARVRKEVKQLLDEVRVEINRINTDINECCNKKSSTSIAPGTLLDKGVLTGYATMNGKRMQLWQTQAGTLVLPDVEVMDSTPWTNPRVQRAGNLARFIEETPAVRQAFPQQVNRKDFVTRFGNEKLPGGASIRELLTTLPEDSAFANLDAMITDLNEREVAALRTTAGATEAVAASLGVGQDVGKVSAAPIEKFGALPPAAIHALSKNGIDTLGKFADLAPNQVQEILRRERIRDMTTADVAEASQVAKSLIRLR